MRKIDLDNVSFLSYLISLKLWMTEVIPEQLTVRIIKKTVFVMKIEIAPININNKLSFEYFTRLEQRNDPG